MNKIEKKIQDEDKQNNTSVVVESFYCNSDDGEYNNDPCAEQCIFCKSAESYTKPIMKTEQSV